jgi:PAS domain S-box-containing protein
MPPPQEIAKRLGSNEHELLSALIASMADAVYAADDAGVVLFANAAAVSILGYGSEGELIGRPSHATIHHSHPDGSPFPEADCPLLRPRRTGEAVRVDQDWFVRRDGSFVPVAYSSAPVAIGQGRGAVVVFRELSHRGLAAAIASLTARTPVPVTLDVPAERFAPLVESTAYFVAAEALANVAKHAQASEAAVTIQVKPDRLVVTVTDDGRGGAVADLAGGSGLAGLTDRVAAVGGTVAVQSRDGGGTRVVAELTLSAPAAE